ncbi:hypothetical protein, partial [Pseudomonas oryzihabitans]|uniref:hypothetical protein n=1 Tax=Pseudomonas oryzihabitans TaxID=47885 RepID=UPI001C930A26
LSPPRPLTEQFCQWHGEAATFSTESVDCCHWLIPVQVLPNFAAMLETDTTRLDVDRRASGQ